MNKNNGTISAPLQRLVRPGITFLASSHGKPIAMQVLRIIDGIALCRSLDLKWTSRWLVTSIQRALDNGTV